MADVLLVGGGTAGHVLPAIATAQAIARLRPGIEVAFAGLAGSLEERLVGGTGLPFHRIEAFPLPRRVTTDLLRVAPRVVRSVRTARALLVEQGIRAVVSFGGYVSLPVALAARGRVPLVLHEQNSRPGLANRLSARSADRVAVTFPSSAARLRAEDRVRITGNPVQQRLRDLDPIARRPDARRRLGLQPNRPTLLVLGGSQGARSINRAVSGAAEAWRSLGVQLVHVTGQRGHEEALAWWRAAGVDPEAGDPEGGGRAAADAPVRVIAFLDDMADAYAAADLVLSRAGATTIAELTVLGLPSILVPYPHATAQHQQGNTEALVLAGAALMLEDGELSPQRVADVVADLLADPGRAAVMARSARAWARPAAAEGVARAVLELLGDTDER